MKMQKLHIVWLAAALLILAAGAPAAAQIDLSVEDIGVEVAKADFRIIPLIGLNTLADLTDHPIEIEVHFDGSLYQALASTVQYMEEHNTCHDYLGSNCGEGECLDIVTFTAIWYGECRYWQLNQCSCHYTIEPYVEWSGFYNQQFCTVIVDPNDLVDELDETNNEMTIALGPVTTRQESWSAVKALYR